MRCCKLFLEPRAKRVENDKGRRIVLWGPGLPMEGVQKQPQAMSSYDDDAINPVGNRICSVVR